jgi:hypothetical protein
MSAQQLASNPFTYVALVGLFIWLIPFWHSLRSGSFLAAIEVLLLLALGVALPVIVGSTSNLGELAPALGALGALQTLGGSALLWLGALLIALAADLGREFRRAERRRNNIAPAIADYPRRG